MPDLDVGRWFFTEDRGAVNLDITWRIVWRHAGDHWLVIAVAPTGHSEVLLGRVATELDAICAAEAITQRDATNWPTVLADLTEGRGVMPTNNDGCATPLLASTFARRAARRDAELSTCVMAHAEHSTCSGSVEVLVAENAGGRGVYARDRVCLGHWPLMVAAYLAEPTLTVRREEVSRDDT